MNGEDRLAPMPRRSPGAHGEFIPRCVRLKGPKSSKKIYKAVDRTVDRKRTAIYGPLPSDYDFERSLLVRGAKYSTVATRRLRRC